MTQYEMMVIINPALPEADRDASIDALKTLLSTKADATVVKEDVWGEKKLAYKINKSETGYYILYTLELNWEKIAEISKEINLDRNFWRYMFVKIED